MREVKFRARNRINKNWTYLFLEEGGGVRFDYPEGGSMEENMEDWQQFTNSRDTKTGEDIYEGHICRQTFNHKTSVGEVRFSPSQGWLVGNWPLWPHDIEIIDNEPENPELFGKKP